MVFTIEGLFEVAKESWPELSGHEFNSHSE